MGFDAFWTIWRPHMRKNDGRGMARETYGKCLAKGAEPQDIADGARWYLASLKERDKEYIPLCATWLNRCAYEDGAILWREFQARLEQSRQKAAERPLDVPKLPKSKFLQDFESKRIVQH
jgi:hypothetical protein